MIQVDRSISNVLTKEIHIKSKYIVWLTAVLLFFIPILLLGNFYNIGGDDTKLYYLFPSQYLHNFVFNIISDNTLGGASTGYDTVAYHAPFIFVIYLIKQIPLLNTQAFFYGLNLSLGFIFFYLFLGLYHPSKARDIEAIKVVASLFYIFSSFLLKTIYLHQIFSLYLISLTPLTLYFFIASIRQQNLRKLFLGVLIFSVFCPFLVNLPWISATFLGLLPLLIFEFANSKWRFVKYAIIFLMTFVLLNFYWIFHFINASFTADGLINNTGVYSSKSFTEDNIRVVSGVATLYSPLNQLFNVFETGFFEHFNWLTIVSGVFLAVILLAGRFFASFGLKERWVYVTSVGCLIGSAFLISPNFGKAGVSFFIFLSTHIPFFTMFRNMYDKFPIVLAFSYAFAFAASLIFILPKIIKKRYLFYGILGAGIICIAVNAYGYTQTLNTGQPAFSSGSFNKDFWDMISYVERLPNASRVLWLPMNAPSYFFVPDDQIHGHYYSGSSLLRILANRSDYRGRFSFILQNDIFYGDKVFEILGKRDYITLGKIYQRLNARFIVTDNENIPANFQTLYFDFFGVNLKDAQGDEYKKIILGQKLADFGSRYSVYQINDSFYNDKLYLADSFDGPPKPGQNLSYTKKSSAEYEISITNLQKEERLIFLDPFYKTWVLYLQSQGQELPLDASKNVVVYDYANGWSINKDEIVNQFPPSFYQQNSDGSLNLKIRLFFTPQRFNPVIYAISLMALILVLGYELFPSLKKMLRLK